MKYILIIGDGMADDPVPELNGKTPLQYANIPTMDRLASIGVLGNVITVPEGMAAGSDTAILSIFGCDPRESYGGRAPLEAAATGIKLSPGDIAYRCNMITFEEQKILSHSAGAIEGDVSDTLIRELFETPVFKEAATKAGIKIYPATSFRHIAVQSATYKNGNTTQAKLDFTLTPPHDHLGEPLGQHLPRGGENAAVLENLMRLAFEILDNHPINTKRKAEGKLPANGIWFWAEGTAIALPSFADKYGKTGCVISAVPLCQGIGVLMGLEKILVEGATGELHTNYEGKVDAAFEALKTRDFVTVHVEAPDECTHNGDIKGKVQAIEWIDSRVIEPLTKRLNENGTDYRMLIMADHRTLTATRGHDGGAVPYILYDSRIDRKTGLSFNETDAAKGEFIKDGTKLMELLFE
jgi:2,3-bisphosphoglycerate-independent phosphoglycerate mutase